MNLWMGKKRMFCWLLCLHSLQRTRFQSGLLSPQLGQYLSVAASAETTATATTAIATATTTATSTATSSS